MADKLSAQDRSKLMSKIKSKNTNIEVQVRKWLFTQGFRYRINVRKLPGSPDIVLKKYRCVIFVNGCFWHGHECPDGHLPKSNTEFWRNKIEKNRERDLRNIQILSDAGWNVITVWECELEEFNRCMEHIVDLIKKIS